MNVPVRAGPAPTVAVVPVPESEMDALLLGRTAVRNFDQYVRNVCINFNNYTRFGLDVEENTSLTRKIENQGISLNS